MQISAVCVFVCIWWLRWVLPLGHSRRVRRFEARRRSLTELVCHSATANKKAEMAGHMFTMFSLSAGINLVYQCTGLLVRLV